MKNKRSYKVLWNVFIFVICGGSLIYGFVQQRRMVESNVQMEACKQQVDSLKTEVERMNQLLATTLKQLEIERNTAMQTINSNKK